MKILAAAVLSLAAISYSLPADACVSAMWRERVAPANSPVAQVDQAATKLAGGHPQEALKLAQKALALRGTKKLPVTSELKARRIAGLAALALGQNALAEENLAVAVKTSPELTPQLAKAQLAAGHAEEAKAQLETRATSTKLDVDSWLTLGEARFKLGDVQGANAAASEALKLAPQNANAVQFQAKVSNLTMTRTLTH